MSQANNDFDDPIRTVGADATAAFDQGPSNPTEHASSEALAIPETGEDNDGNDEEGAVVGDGEEQDSSKGDPEQDQYDLLDEGTRELSEDKGS